MLQQPARRAAVGVLDPAIKVCVPGTKTVPLRLRDILQRREQADHPSRIAVDIPTGAGEIAGERRHLEQRARAAAIFGIDRREPLAQQSGKPFTCGVAGSEQKSRRL